MEEQTAPAKKPWYKKWWGIVIIVLAIWPYFLAWYAWAKTEWNKAFKLLLTIPAAFAVVIGAVAMTAPQSNITNRPNVVEQPKTQSEKTAEAPESPPPPPPAEPTPQPTPPPPLPPASTKTTTPAPQAAPPPPPPAQTSNCDPNYTGACVPNVYPADVDCSSGSGNGPYYVKGPVKVVGTDRYGLDSNHDGTGCEKG